MTNSPEYPVQLAVYESGALFDPLDYRSCARFVRAAKIADRCTPKTSLGMLDVMGAVSVVSGLGEALGHTVYRSCIDKREREYTILHEACAYPLTLSLMREELNSDKCSVYAIAASGGAKHVN